MAASGESVTDQKIKTYIGRLMSQGRKEEVMKINEIALVHLLIRKGVFSDEEYKGEILAQLEGNIQKIFK